MEANYEKTQKRLINKTCLNCGNEFEAKSHRAKFCSDKCRFAYHQRERRRKEKKMSWIKKLDSKHWTMIGIIFVLVAFIIGLLILLNNLAAG